MLPLPTTIAWCPGDISIVIFTVLKIKKKGRKTALFECSVQQITGQMKKTKKEKNKLRIAVSGQ